MTVHYVVAERVCPACGAHSPADTSTQIATPLGPIDHGVVFRVGDRSGDLGWAVVRTHYAALHKDITVVQTIAP